MTRGPVEPADVEVVTGLLRRRLATSWRLRAAAVGLGWLVLMTVWGFGRAQTGVTWGPWLVAGLVAALLATVGQWRRVDRNVTGWRARLADLDTHDPSSSEEVG